ncbi:MAG: 6-phosphofructokinase [bacterium]|nr:6-phosphofructokinase [bacterium]
MARKQKEIRSLGVLTSGGDAPGMNSAVRAVVRTALHEGFQVYVIKEGYDGLVNHGTTKNDFIVRADWDYVGGIMDKGGTKIGTSRCDAFKEKGGKAQQNAAFNLIEHGIDHLVIIGGDGSLTGAAVFHKEWAHLLDTLEADKRITAQQKQRFDKLAIVGLVGSIDNDMCRTDMTIGTDTALHRISQAIDAIISTAASHQRIFVVKVMGRHCGYLAVMGGLITGADWVIIPEDPPVHSDWKNDMVQQLKMGRHSKRSLIVILSEGVMDCTKTGTENPGCTTCKKTEISHEEVAEALKEGLKEPGQKEADVRVTVLGHVQRGGSPSAYDRVLSSRLGYAAIKRIMRKDAFNKPHMLGVKGSKITDLPLLETIAENRKISAAIDHCDYKTAMAGRGNNFRKSYDAARLLMSPRENINTLPLPKDAPRLVVLHSGAPAPGMNAAVRAAARFAIARGFEMWGAKRGFEGLMEGDFQPLDWTDVNGWASEGGAELETSRKIPENTKDFSKIEKHLEDNRIRGLLVIGGWSGYKGSWNIYRKYKKFQIPIICLPASINNNLPGTELCVGPDTALNNIVDALDKIKQSAVATRRCFVVEVMGRYCGYLALMSGLAGGAERVYLPEEPVTLDNLNDDLHRLQEEFRKTKRRLALIIRNEKASKSYDTAFMTALFDEEGKRNKDFDARQAILGHLQQGGKPSAFDRILAAQMAESCINFLVEKVNKKEASHAFIGTRGAEMKITPMGDFPRMIDTEEQQRVVSKEQWWWKLNEITHLLSREPW